MVCKSIKKRKKYALTHDLLDGIEGKLLQHLPFTLTHAQKRVITDIEQDLTLDCPMMRLVQGDVGSGKTIVAAFAH